MKPGAMWMLGAWLASLLMLQGAYAATAATAIVVEDRVLLRAEARDSAQPHATLWKGDVLEVRGERMDYLQVYDHRHERAGFVPVAQVRRLDLRPERAAELMVVVRFVRDSPGDESLGIGYAAAYLQAAAAEAIDAEIFDALGSLADRLARRGSLRQSKASAEQLTAHLDVAASYGVSIRSFEHAGRMQLCYDGEAFRRVMALPATPARKANAALALTRLDCVDPDLTPLDRYAYDAWRADVLDRVPTNGLPNHTRNRLRLRSAAVRASVAFAQARLGNPGVEAASLSLRELGGVERLQLAERDGVDYDEAAVRVGASRWAAEGAPEVGSGAILHKASGLALLTRAGEPGQTCILLIDSKHAEKAPLLKHCTYATLWTASARANAQGNVIALAAQPLDSWRELWVLQRAANGWKLDVVPPGDVLDVGYVEFAGWIPGTRKLLAARETRNAGRFVQRFEIIDLDRMLVDKHAEKPEYLSQFYRWQDAQWKRQTVSLR